MRILNRTLWILKNLVFPPRCPICDTIIPISINSMINRASIRVGINGTCKQCSKSLGIVQEPRCLRCSKHISGDKDYCFDCLDHNHYYNKGIAIFEYDYIRKSIYRFKYHGRLEYSTYYGDVIEGIYSDAIKEWRADAIVPVPIHRKRLARRGYNQSNILAQEIGSRLNISVVDDWIIRIKNTVPQKELNHTERQNNLKSSFINIRNDVKLSSVIIIDDIYTTGSTINELAAKLIELGVERIYFITLAIGMGM